ncbi:T-complex protein 1 subunit eta [Hibiscus syriacus]|uniref:T-complex protein 1 subunit eta n=1 Tax=Hibiscus syriacus TaxID=106335 RepID=A0A6A2ZJA1_HIBSY|nr:T-complex protein 1 subunit eta [Hibiscus syriacus]
MILLKEGTDTSQGMAQLVSNINACTAVADIVRTTLGPRGMDKLIHDDKGNVTVSNDGATIMKLLDIVHPAANVLVDIAKSQDSEVGDGTTTVVLLAGEFLKEAKPFVEDGVHPQNLIRSYRTACNLAIEKIKELAFSIEGKSLEEKKNLLAKSLGCSLCLDSCPLVIELRPKKFLNPKIHLLNIELELKSEKENAEIRLSDPSQYQSIVDAEWNIIYDKLDKCVKSGAKVVLSRLAIGDLATQLRKIFTGWLRSRNMWIFFEEKVVGNERFNIFSGCPSGRTATIVLRGGADQFIEEAERSLHDAIMIVRRALKNSTVVAGVGAIDMEISRYLRQHARTIAGKSQLFINSYANALELGDHCIMLPLYDFNSVFKKVRLGAKARRGEGGVNKEEDTFSERCEVEGEEGDKSSTEDALNMALGAAYYPTSPYPITYGNKVIPRQLCDDAGSDATDVLNKLRQKYVLPSGEGAPDGVDINTGGIADSFANFVWEPSLVKVNAINAATEAACLILSVDETVKNPKSESAQGEAAASAMGGRGRGGGFPGRGRGMRWR